MVCSVPYQRTSDSILIVNDRRKIGKFQTVGCHEVNQQNRKLQTFLRSGQLFKKLLEDSDHDLVYFPAKKWTKASHLENGTRT